MELLFYKNIVNLNKEQHQNLKVVPAKNYGFAAHTNSVPLTAVEFAEASKEYPITFAKSDGDQYTAVAILGFENEENLFIGHQGEWLGHYIPAFVRRYPFVLAANAATDPLLVCLDMDSPSVNEEEGEPLFVQGDSSAYLRQTLGFLQEFHQQSLLTEAFTKKLADWGLLTERQADAATPDGMHFTLSGLWVVDEAALRALAQEKVLEIFASGELGLIYLHMASLGNFSRLLGRKQPKPMGKGH